MTNHRRLLPWMLLCVFCFPVMAEAEDSGTVTLRLRWRHQFQFAGYYAALEKGYYSAAGLNVRLEEVRESEDSCDAVMNGLADYGVGGSDLVVDRATGKPVVVLAAIFQHSPMVIVADQKLGITSVHDLAGKRIAMEKQSAVLVAYLQHEGMRLDQMTVLPHPFDPSPLAKGEVDAMSAFSTDEPFQLAQMGVDCVIMNPRTGGIDFYGDCLFTSEHETAAHPERVKAFLDASLRGWKYALDHQEELVQLILDKYSTRHSADHLRFEARETAKLVLPNVVEVGYINPGRWRYIADTFAELGMMPRGAPLAGFIYERNPRPDERPYYAVIAGLSVLLVAVGSIVFWFYRMNRSLRHEMEERSRAEAALRNAELRFRLLVERAPFPIAISDPETGRVRFCNRQWKNEFLPGEASEETGDRSTADFYDNPEDRAGILRLLEHSEHVRDYEVKLRRLDGTTLWAFLSAALVEFGGIRTLFVAFNDITARKSTEEENDRLIHELQQALQDVKTLRGLVPICSYCKRIRNDDGFWQQLDTYLHEHTDAELSHGVCPECEARLYQDFRGETVAEP